VRRILARPASIRDYDENLPVPRPRGRRSAGPRSSGLSPLEKRRIRRSTSGAAIRHGACGRRAPRVGLGRSRSDGARFAAEAGGSVTPTSAERVDPRVHQRLASVRRASAFSLTWVRFPGATRHSTAARRRPCPSRFARLRRAAGFHTSSEPTTLVLDSPGAVFAAPRILFCEPHSSPRSGLSLRGLACSIRRPSRPPRRGSSNTSVGHGCPHLHRRSSIRGPASRTPSAGDPDRRPTTLLATLPHRARFHLPKARAIA